MLCESSNIRIRIFVDSPVHSLIRIIFILAAAYGADSCKSQTIGAGALPFYNLYNVALLMLEPS
ncbi:hypothetical protein A3B21_00870 [Candidatus Uhrbacteria bacterium RIFCSPLOWO2_01_FULL_47_24]|uniref:Uncharacterized protein n=1 Tax=Candidatus Uhrbacteria bacterium RIFCSPLOWO2_01_FULL_47_24 TaxID=1802401 RepID=A0A1F7UQH4_9BACT|nr:MAG: hypothetical protein A2753_00240 [Candidatus Uhrbacteria bacterium RIFCSPHIGHO2_01_FULL_47_11]OGL68582.1 MAG: hypothetical protein A3D58_02545 [Candidatus Uhrbacteria bacterium RIFCSPHIGHO2_02_FULL_46_47]OGL79927.1 MAG: hypothetical protein A3B21_00870 [Candidatus Uhrbacteria bacterium RIFCSPLOWO2_01_FULL_47_24]OGL84788.1 MAG: hypothetical protein A3J03_01300 [Candidatus Uhrbacteria bacterium RIFCSPLOWO2_02_FULL_46_25]